MRLNIGDSTFKSANCQLYMCKLTPVFHSLFTLNFLYIWYAIFRSVNFRSDFSALCAPN